MNYLELVKVQWRASRGVFVCGVLSVLVYGVVLVGSIQGVGKVSQFLVDGRVSAFWFWLFLTLGCFLALLVLNNFLNAIATRMAERVMVVSSGKMAQMLLRTSDLGTLEDEVLVTKVKTLNSELRDFAGMSGVQFFWQLLSYRVAGAIGFFMVARWSILAALVLAAVLWLNSWIFGKYLLSTRLDASDPDLALQRRQADYFRQLNLTQSSAKEVRIFGLSHWNVQRFSAGWNQVMVEVWAKRNHRIIFTLFSSLLLPLAFAGCFIWLVWSGLVGQVELGTVVATISAVGWLDGLGALGDIQSNTAQFAVTERKISALCKELAAKGVAQKVAGSGQRLTPGLALSVTDLRFKYQNSTRQVLAGLNLDVPEGQHLAIVGENGVGKSTLIKLICGLYLPLNGEISTSGRVKVVFQDFVHWPVSVRENIMFDNQSDELLSSALEKSDSVKLVDNLQKGVETVLSSTYAGGSDLSGGQWQRIAMARGLADFGDNDILVLDEPTAELDVKTETELFNRLLEVTAGKTMILASHRLNSVRRADRIIVIDSGGIVEDGSHDELMALGGRYAEMFEIQSRRYLEEAGEHEC